ESNNDIQCWAHRYLSRSYQLVRIPRVAERLTKGPREPGWQKQRYSEADLHVFQPDDNLGLNLGSASNGLADVDLDTPSAVAAAAYFLPETSLIGGHGQPPSSHYFYQIVGPGSVI